MRRGHATSVVLHAVGHIKLRLLAKGGAANPRNGGTIAVVYPLPRTKIHQLYLYRQARNTTQLQ